MRGGYRRRQVPDRGFVARGGMGAVFSATHLITGLPLALKWQLHDPRCDAEASHRLLREARAASRVRHPNVVDVYDVGEHDGTLFLVMELLEGSTLAALLGRRGALDVRTALEALLPAMRGVAAAHRRQVTFATCIDSVANSPACSVTAATSTEAVPNRIVQSIARMLVDVFATMILPYAIPACRPVGPSITLRLVPDRVPAESKKRISALPAVCACELVANSISNPKAASAVALERIGFDMRGPPCAHDRRVRFALRAGRLCKREASRPARPFTLRAWMARRTTIVPDRRAAAPTVADRRFRTEGKLTIPHRSRTP
jgi:hypothetical protein